MYLLNQNVDIRPFFKTASELPATVLIHQELIPPFLRSAISSLQHALRCRRTPPQKFTLG